jgi:Uma2 family endonuclease
LPRKQFEGPFDLIGEVLSPSNRDDDLEDKRPAYREAGVQEIWLIDLANEEVLVDRRLKKGYRTSRLQNGRVLSHVLDGFWIDAGWLWSDPLPTLMDCLQEILK